MIVKNIALALAGIIGLTLAGCKPSGPTEAPEITEPASVTNQPISEDQSLAQDWPQWRHDASRSANSPAELPGELHLQWTRQYAPRLQVWDDPFNHDLMPYDKIFEPVVLEERMFIGFNDRDKVVALDTATGQELWTFFTDGPVRLPPAAWQGKVYFVSDDGHLYCVNAGDGSLAWKFRGAPGPQKVLGNGRVISAWPARGGVVVRDGQVYFTASIWPFMGTFIYALDAVTGRVVWANDGTGAQYIKQPHSAPAFAGVAPQGPLAATRDLVLVPGGRSVPAAFDRKTGRFLYFQLEDSGKGNGGSFVAAGEAEYFVHTRLRGTRSYDLKTGKKGGFTINEPVLVTNRLFSIQEASALKTAVLEAEQKLALARQGQTEAVMSVEKAQDDGSRSGYKDATNTLASAKRKVARAKADVASAQKALGTNYAGGVIQATGWDKKVRWELPTAGTGDIIKAGHHLYAAHSNGIVTVELLPNKLARLVRTNAVEGQVLRLLAANGRLFAVTLDGRIMAFGGAKKEPVTLAEASHLSSSRRKEAQTPLEPGLTNGSQSLPTNGKDGFHSVPNLVRQERDGVESVLTKAILDQAGARQGYALCFGVDDGALLEALVEQSELRIVAVDPEAAKIEKLRRRFDAAGIYGSRVALHAGDPLSFRAPPYLANLIVVGDSFAGRLTNRLVLSAIYESLRPYGGMLWVPVASGDPVALADRISTSGLAGAKVSIGQNNLTVVREGPLPGSADWTHQYGDVGNSVKSDDKLVKLPLGLLWFGGPTHMDVLPRHGHGPSEQVAEGRLFIEGMKCLSARDVYTGRVLWKTELNDLDNYGVYFDWSYTNAPLSTIYNQKHIPGANARGANFVATPREVYVAASNVCHVLDAQTGQVTRTMALPKNKGEAAPRPWGYLGLSDNVLLAGNGFALYTRQLGLSTSNRTTPIVDLSASRGLVAFNRQTGERFWTVEARHSFVHNGIVAGHDRVYCIDRLPKSVEEKLRRRGRPVPSDYRLVCLDLHTGRLLWEKTNDVFGTWLGYSKEHDVLLQAGATATDRLKDEAEKGMITYRGADGTELWKNLERKYTGPCILRHDMILTTPIAYKTNAGAFGLLDGRPRLVTNPLTGLAEPLRIYRTYGCNYPIACEHLLTFRSGAAGFYDLENNGGTGNLGGASVKPPKECLAAAVVGPTAKPPPPRGMAASRACWNWSGLRWDP